MTVDTTTFERDPAFDIAAYWAEASARFNQRVPEYHATLKVHPATMMYVTHSMAGRYTILEKGNEWLILRVTYTVFEEARTSVLGLGVAATVIAPPELHQAVIEQARAIVAFHDDGV